MRSSLDASSEIFLANLARAQERLDRAQRQLSSGRKMATASDDPDEVGPLLQLRAELSRNEQIEKNLARAGVEAGTAENTLSQALKLMDRTLALAAEANRPAITPAIRANLGTEVRGIQELMVTLSQMRVEGRYIFSGDLDQYPAYQLDSSSGTGVAELTTAWATRRLEDPAGGSFATSLTARSIFDFRNPDDTLAEGNVFNALNTLRVALEDNDAGGIEQAVGLIRESAAHLNAQIGFYGNVQRRVEQGANYAKAFAVRIESAISHKQDTDVTAAALELSQANLQVQTALQARAQLPRTTLFDLMG